MLNYRDKNSELFVLFLALWPKRWLPGLLVNLIGH
jgi:hypothetical protein